jgi:hypothetical protein
VKSPIVLTAVLPLIAGACAGAGNDTANDPKPIAGTVLATACPDPIAIGGDVAEELDRVCPLDGAGRSPCPALEDLVERLFRLNDQLTACRSDH